MGGISKVGFLAFLDGFCWFLPLSCLTDKYGQPGIGGFVPHLAHQRDHLPPVER
jgi:hypothetical protein